MSLEATWDLSTASSPRSFCVYTPTEESTTTTTTGHKPSFTAHTNTSNPFEVAAAHTPPTRRISVGHAVVVGTERGSLHYRTYASMGGTTTRSGLAGTAAAAATTIHPSQVQAALGTTTTTTTTSSSTTTTTTIPRSYHPVDYSGLPGPVVSLVPIIYEDDTEDDGNRTTASSGTNSSGRLFLALVDDHRGTSAAHPGAFVAHWMILKQGRWGLWQPPASATTTTANQPPLPRMSCAVYHPHCGLVYAAGRQLGQLPIPDVHSNNNNNNTSTTSRLLGGSRSATPRASHPRTVRPWTYRFGRTTLPAPGARSGPDALAVNTNGSVVVVAVGTAFVAVSGIPTAGTSSSTMMMMMGRMDDDSHNNNNNNGGMPDHTNINSSNNNSSSNSVGSSTNTTITKLLSFPQSSQVHPVLCLDVQDPSLLDHEVWSCWFLASSRSCAVVDFCNHRTGRTHCHFRAGTSSHNNSSSKTTDPTNTNNNATTTLASPILAAATAWPWLVVLTSDGLLSVRSPSCLAIALRTVEVGTRPNDYFALRTLLSGGGGGAYTSTSSSSASSSTNFIVAISYAGHAKVLTCRPDSYQDLADRLMRLAIDALGANGFPRAALAEALQASFTATSYVGPEPTVHARTLFQHYLEAVLGLMDLESGAITSWPIQPPSGSINSGSDGGGSRPRTGGGTNDAVHQGAFGEAHSNPQQQQQHQPSRNPTARRSSPWSDRLPPVLSAASPPSLLTGTALLCLACASLQPAQASLANRAAKKCVSQLGMIVTPQQLACDGAVQVCETVAETLLQESTHHPQSASNGSSSTTEFSLLPGSSPKPIVASAKTNTGGVPIPMEFVEAAVWLLRSCGLHERAMQVLYDRMQQQQQIYAPQSQQPSSQQQPTSRKTPGSGGWSQIKYDSYTATHLSELWGSGREEGCQLVLQSPATQRLLEQNPRLGLSAFTALHPENPAQWKALKAHDDPLAHPTYPRQVLQLLQSIQPVVPYESSRNKNNNNTAPAASSSEDSSSADHNRIMMTHKSTTDDDDDDRDDPVHWATTMPLESGRALSVAFLESALGIATGRPSEQDEFDALPREDGLVERMADFHDELAFLLLEGVLSERGDTEAATASTVREPPTQGTNNENETVLGRIYRQKLRRLLRWPLCQVRPDRFLAALPQAKSFWHERALALGNLGRHEEALTIFYRDLKQLDLALEYCDLRHERIQEQREREKARRQQQGGGFFDDLVVSDQERTYYDSYGKGGASAGSSDCAYLPLVRVALETSETPEEGTKAAIQVLALRRSVMDWGAALRLLPKDVPVSAVARPFLIPALVESESQVRRLTVVSSLLRSRYSSLKQQLTAAQLKAQENLHVVPQLRNLNLGNPLHSTKPFRARPSSSVSPTFPDVMIIKHFFPRHLVIQAKVKHNLDGRSLGDVNFVVAESSEEAIQPSLQVPLKVLPYNVQGSTWCVLSASPQRMDSLAILTCELRYTILDAEGTAGFTAMDTVSAGASRSYVEELQDLEVYATHFQK